MPIGRIPIFSVGDSTLLIYQEIYFASMDGGLMKSMGYTMGRENGNAPCQSDFPAIMPITQA